MKLRRNKPIIVVNSPTRYAETDELTKAVLILQETVKRAQVLFQELEQQQRGAQS